MDDQNRKFIKDRFASTKNILISERLSTYQPNPAAWSQWILHRFPFESHDRILEIGCGIGSFWSDIHKQLPTDLKIILTDASPAMVSSSKKRLPSFTDLNFLVNDVENICFQNESFNTVFANHVLHIVPDIKTAISEIQRILRPDGLLIFSTIRKDHLKELGAVLMDLNSVFKYPMDTFLRFSSNDLRTFLADIFDIIQNDVFLNRLEVTDIDLILEIALSIFNGLHYPDLKPLKNQFRQIVFSEMEKNGGVFCLNESYEIFVCKKIGLKV